MLSIVIVNYYGRDILFNCVQSVINNTHDIDYEILIIDNSNDDYTKGKITQTFPQVIWKTMAYNSGFGRANNEAFKMAVGDAVLLLNPDCIAETNVIGACYQRFMDSHYVACGISLKNEDGSFQISGNKAFKGGLNYLLPIPYFGHIIKAMGSIFKVEKPHIEKTQQTQEVDWISGAYLMVKKSIIQQVGGFDEDFFLYAEEAEWCSRLKKAGPLCIFGDLEITHLLGALTTGAFGGESNSYKVLHDKKGLQIMLSNMVRIRKQFGLGWFFFMMLAYIFSAFISLPLACLDSLFTRTNKLRRSVGFFKNAIKLWRYFPKIVANKAYFYKIL